jgi:pimeloyl-ACP methyl ester carboxylesterase
MSESLQFLDVAGAGGASRKIAFLRSEGDNAAMPGVMWLCGFNSEMANTKASALAPWTEARGAGLLRFDYSGHGASGGRLEDFTIGDWLAEAVAAFTELTAGPQIVVGSSMGGWLALLLARELRRSAPSDAARIRALVLIAPAWDMTETLIEKQLSPEARAILEREGVFWSPSEYGAPVPIARTFIEEGRRHALGADRFDPGCPVRILHGMQDGDVPWRHSLQLVDLLGNDDVQLTLVKDGEHRMSREGDLALLFGVLNELM